MNFEKYSEKSYVVRGDTLEDSVKRKEFVKQLQGNGIWNTRLKGGPGLLVSINEHNKSLLEKKREEDKREEDKSVQDSDYSMRTDVSDEENNKHKMEYNTRREEDQTNEELNRSTNIFSRRKYSLPTKRPTREVSSESENEIHDSHRRKNDSSQESEDESEDDYRRKRTPQRTRRSQSSEELSESDRSSRGSSRGSSKKKYHRSRSPVSSSDSEDSSEDERIQHSIRRKKDNRHSRKEIIEGPIDSDSEDIVNLSRRLRGLMTRIDMLEKRSSFRK